MRLYNNRTEQDEEIPNELAGNLILSGSHSPYEDDDVTVINREGDLEIIKGKALGKALDVGWTIPDAELSTAHKDSLTFGEKDGEAFAAAAARGALAGISDQVLVRQFGVDPAHLAKLKEYNPYLSTAGEITGIVGSLLFPYGRAAGAAAKLVGAGAKAEKIAKAVDVASDFIPSKAFNKANLAVENVVGKAMQKGFGITQDSGLIAKALTTYLPKAAGSAVEGSLYGVGQAVSENALGDPELNAESLFAFAKNAADKATLGAVWGGMLGAAIPAAMDGFVHAAIKAPDLIGKTARAFGRYARIDDNKVDDFMKEPFDVPKDARGNIINREDFADRLVKTSENFRQKVKEGSLEVTEAENLLKYYEDIYSNNSDAAKTNLQEAKRILEEKIKERKENIKNAPVDPELVDAIKNTFLQAEKYRNDMSKEAFDILENTPNIIIVEEGGKKYKKPTYISVDNVLNFIKRSMGNVDETIDRIPFAKGEAQQQFFDLVDKKTSLFKKYKKEVNDVITPPKVKEFIQAIDEDISLKGGWWNESPDINFLKKLREYLDSRVKDAVPAYQEKMLVVKDLTEILKTIRKQYGKSVKQLASEAEEIYFDDMAIKSRLIDIARNKRGGSGLMRTIEDASGYLPENLRPTTDIQRKLGKMINDYQFAYGIGAEADRRLQRIIEVDPELSSLQNSATLFQEEANSYLRGNKYVKRRPDQIFEKEIVNNLEALKNVVEQRQKYQDVLEKFKLAEEDFNVWKDVATTEDALNKLSQWESKGKKETLDALLRQKQQSLKQFFGSMSDLSDEEFRNLVNVFRLDAAFDKTAGGSSKNVNFAALVVGGVLGYSSPLGPIIGAILGVWLDGYAPKVAKSVLRQLSRVRGAITPERLNKIMRDNMPSSDEALNQAAYNVTGKIEQANKTLINKLRFSVSNYFNKPISAIRAAGINLALNHYEETRDKFKQIVDKQGLVNNNFHSMNEIPYMVAPATTENYLAVYNRAVNFMKTKFPTMDMDEITNFKPSDTEKLKFMRYMAYVEDPYIVFDRMDKGIIESDGIEVLKAVYPSIFKVLEGEVSREILRNDPKKIPILKKSEITREFGYQFAHANSPLVFGILQKPAQQQEETMQGKNINLKSKAGSRNETAMNRISNRV